MTGGKERKSPNPPPPLSAEVNCGRPQFEMADFHLDPREVLPRGRLSGWDQEDCGGRDRQGRAALNARFRRLRSTRARALGGKSLNGLNERHK